MVETMGRRALQNSQHDWLPMAQQKAAPFGAAFVSGGD
jgi:hypothetical protein